MPLSPLPLLCGSPLCGNSRNICFFLKEEMFLNNEISPPSSLLLSVQDVMVGGHTGKKQAKPEDRNLYWFLASCTTYYTLYWLLHKANGVSLFFFLSFPSKKSCGNAAKKEHHKFWEKLCFTTESFYICIQDCKSSSDLEALIWFSNYTTLKLE